LLPAFDDDDDDDGTRLEEEDDDDDDDDDGFLPNQPHLGLLVVERRCLVGEKAANDVL